jgi:hypothetical protein
LDVSKHLWRLHVDDGLYLLWVAFDPSLGDEVALQLAGGYPEGALLWVKLDAISVEVGKGFSKVIEQAICLCGLDDDVVDVDLDIAANLFLQSRLHAPLIGGSGVLEPEGHRHVAVYPVRGDEGRLVFVFYLQSYLIISGVGVEERKAFAPCCGVDDLVDSGQGEVVESANFVSLVCCVLDNNIRNFKCVLSGADFTAQQLVKSFGRRHAVMGPDIPARGRIIRPPGKRQKNG